MQIERTEQFVDDYRRLATVDRRRVDAALRRLLSDPSGSGLRFGKLVGRQDLEGRDMKWEETG